MGREWTLAGDRHAGGGEGESQWGRRGDWSTGMFTSTGYSGTHTGLAAPQLSVTNTAVWTINTAVSIATLKVSVDDAAALLC